MAGKASQFSSLSDVVEAATVFHKKADAAFDMMDFAKGIEAGRRAMELFAMVDGYHEKKSDCRYMYALCLEREGFIDEAEAHYTENWEEACEKFGRTHAVAFDCMIPIISLNCCSVRHDRAVAFIKEFLASDGEELHPIGKGTLLKEMSYAQSDLGLHQEAFDSVEEAIRVLKGSRSDALLDAYDLHAALHQERGSPGLALKVVEEAFKANEEMGLESMTLKKRLAFIHFDMGMYSKALEVYEEALVNHLVNEGEDSTLTLRARQNCSELYLELGQFSDAEQQADAVLDEEGTQGGRGGDGWRTQQLWMSAYVIVPV